MYNTDMMGVYHEDERPPSNKEEPPIIKETRTSVQHDGSSGLSNGVIHGDHTRAMFSGDFSMVYICLSPGCKPYLGLHNSTNIY